MWQQIRAKLASNWKSGLTVALVSIPLSISLAVASHASPVVGIVTAIWAGVTAAIFGGSNYNIVGPTGALSGVIATHAIVHGTETLPMLALTTGLTIAMAYILRLERYLVLIPSSVIHGFTLGVAFIIAFNQFNFALGLAGLPVHEKFIENLVESWLHVGSFSPETVGIFALFLVGLFWLKKTVPRIPGAIILTPVGIGLGYLSSVGILPLPIATLGSKFGALQLQLFQMPKLYFSMELLTASLTIAVVAILETLLSAKIADGMTHTKHNERKEMRGLALANVVSGLMGGMPATAALARTSLNIKSGANHATSASLSTVFIVLISLLLLSYFVYIPMAVIAAILVYVAIQMVEAEHFLKYLKHDKSGFWVAILVAGVTVYEDPIVGMMVGTLIAMFMFVERLSHGHFDVVLNTFKRGPILTTSGTQLEQEEMKSDFSLYSVRGKLCYINSRAHVARFETNFRKHRRIILRLREVYFIDIDGVNAVDEIIDIVVGRGQQIIITGAKGEVQDMLGQLSEGYQQLLAQGLVFVKTQDAIEFLKQSRS